MFIFYSPFLVKREFNRYDNITHSRQVSKCYKRFIIYNLML